MGKTKSLSDNPLHYSLLLELFKRSSDEKKVVVDKLVSLLGSRRYGSLLDIGAGDGALTQQLMPYFDDVYAIDIVDSHLYLLRSVGISAERCSFEKYNPNLTFDVILASHVIHRFKHREKEIRRMIELAKTKGRIFIIYNSGEGDFADFTKELYEGELRPVKTREMVKRLNRQAIHVSYETIETRIVFENKAHYRALARFLLDCDFRDNDPLGQKVDDYYQRLSKVDSYGDRRQMVINETLIRVVKDG